MRSCPASYLRKGTAARLLTKTVRAASDRCFGYPHGRVVHRGRVSAKRYGAKLSDHFLANFLELRQREVRRTPVASTRVDRGIM